MKILQPGHIYRLAYLDGPGDGGWDVLTFVCRAVADQKPHPGTYNQEVLRALIDRVQYLDRQLPWRGNAEILQHLRMALVLHESRALERKAEKRLYAPERVGLGADGHYLLETSDV